MHDQVGLLANTLLWQYWSSKLTGMYNCMMIYFAGAYYYTPMCTTGFILTMHYFVIMCVYTWFDFFKNLHNNTILQFIETAVLMNWHFSSCIMRIKKKQLIIMRGKGGLRLAPIIMINTWAWFNRIMTRPSRDIKWRLRVFTKLLEFNSIMSRK